MGGVRTVGERRVANGVRVTGGRPANGGWTVGGPAFRNDALNIIPVIVLALRVADGVAKGPLKCSRSN